MEKEIEFKTIKEVLGLPPGKYKVIGKEDHPELSGPWGNFSMTTVEDINKKQFSIPTGNAQVMGLIPLSE